MNRRTFSRNSRGGGTRRGGGCAEGRRDRERRPRTPAHLGVQGNRGGDGGGVQANRRFARGVQFGAAWTWSKALDYVDVDGGAITNIVSPRVWNYGLAGFDRTHLFRLNYLWDVPGGRWKSAVSKWILHDWQVSGLTSVIRGAPLGVGYSFVTAKDITGTSDLGARIVVTGDPVLPKSERTFFRNFRTEAFAHRRWARSATRRRP